MIECIYILLVSKICTMRLLLTIALSFTYYCSIAQPEHKKLDTYKASNGIVYKKGDTVKIGKGSNFNGNFKHFYNYSIGGFAAGYAGGGLGRTFGGTNAILRQIYSEKERGATKVMFKLNIRGSAYIVDIDLAISDCEIYPCAKDVPIQNSTSIADELTKLKKLRDEGVLTEEEFQSQKTKLLKSN